jgi:hypothetical protein
MKDRAASVFASYAAPPPLDNRLEQKNLPLEQMNIPKSLRSASGLSCLSIIYWAFFEVNLEKLEKPENFLKKLNHVFPESPLKGGWHCGSSLWIYFHGDQAPKPASTCKPASASAALPPAKSQNRPSRVLERGASQQAALL